MLLLVRLARSEQTVRVLTRDAVGNFPGNGRGAVGRGREQQSARVREVERGERLAVRRERGGRCTLGSFVP